MTTKHRISILIFLYLLGNSLFQNITGAKAFAQEVAAKHEIVAEHEIGFYSA